MAFCKIPLIRFRAMKLGFCITIPATSLNGQRGDVHPSGLQFESVENPAETLCRPFERIGPIA